MADEVVDHGHDPASESTFEGAPSLWPPCITLFYNHHTPNSRPSSCNIQTHNHPAYG